MKDDIESNENQICIHIFSVSAALVGVCLTVIGIFRAVGELKKFSSVGDDILAIDAIIFLVSCILAYSALRSKTHKTRAKIERIADVFFMIGLSLMTIVCGIIAYTFI